MTVDESYAMLIEPIITTWLKLFISILIIFRMHKNFTNLRSTVAGIEPLFSSLLCKPLDHHDLTLATCYSSRNKYAAL